MRSGPALFLASKFSKKSKDDRFIYFYTIYFGKKCVIIGYDLNTIIIGENRFEVQIKR